MDSLINWFDMNGYAQWVWSAYALWALGFAWLVFGTLRGRKQALVQITNRYRRSQMQPTTTPKNGDNA